MLPSKTRFKIGAPEIVAFLAVMFIVVGLVLPSWAQDQPIPDPAATTPATAPEAATAPTDPAAAPPAADPTAAPADPTATVPATDPTAAPPAADPTAAPPDPTAAPADPTAAPADPSAAPVDPTATVPAADPTAAPPDPTAASADPTAAPPAADPTAAPADPKAAVPADGKERAALKVVDTSTLSGQAMAFCSAFGLELESNIKECSTEDVTARWKAMVEAHKGILDKELSESERKVVKEHCSAVKKEIGEIYTDVTYACDCVGSEDFKKVKKTFARFVKGKPKKGSKGFLEKIAPILLLLLVVAIVISRLPKVEGLGHTDAFRRRRVMNWLPLGTCYALLYMGRYNLTVAKDAIVDSCGVALMNNADFALIFGIGTGIYGFSFIINGPLTDRIGGKKAILIGATGSAIMNLVMGITTMTYAGADPGEIPANLKYYFAAMYGVNMYFQSFGAVSIVKVNAPWFHVNERGVFGAIFGILISLGVYLAFDVGYMIVSAFDSEFVFFIPSGLLFLFVVIVFIAVRNTPGEAGHDDFDTADASSGDDGPQKTAIEVFKMMAKNPVIVTIACIEFCSGFLRQAIMQWYRTLSKQIGVTETFVYENWGMLLCCAGILGGVVAGVISDRVFNSRRGPVATILYGAMLVGAIILTFIYTSPMMGWLVILMSMAVIGVHGMLSGTASMDFGGKKNVGVAVGIIDGFVYAGTAVMSLTYGILLPDGEAAKEVSNWYAWPIAMIPMALIGVVLARKIWNAKPKGKSAGGH